MITIAANKKITIDPTTIMSGDTGSVQIPITLPLTCGTITTATANVYLLVKTLAGSDMIKLVLTTDTSAVTSGWTIESAQTGTLYIQIEVQSGDTVWMSKVGKLTVSASTDATGEIVEIYPGILTDHEDRIKTLEGTMVTAAEALDAANRAEAAESNTYTLTEAAASSQTQAANSETAAAGSAAAALASEQAAGESQTAAEGSANSAASSKTAAETAKTAAETARSSAESAATFAGSAASTATQKATDASASATAAGTSATNAANSATAAATSATNAASSASAAAQSATDAANTLASKADKAKIFYPDNVYGCKLTDNVDTITVTGRYNAYGTATGVPNTTESWYIDHHNSSVGTTSAVQVATGYTSGSVYRRYKQASAWGAWVDTSYGQDMLIVNTLTPTNYAQTMREFFYANGCAALADLSSICDKWYLLTRTGWTGGTTFAQPSQSSLSTGTKTGNNAGLSCTPSTNTVAGTDDYAGLPLFAPIDCNVYLDSSGKPHITAIENVAGSFSRTTPTAITGVLQMAGWVKKENGDTTYSYGYTDIIGAAGYSPLPEAIDLDGTVRTWVVHGKYLAGDDNGCYSGVPVRVWDISHNSSLTNFHNTWGSRYCGKTTADDAFVKLMVYLKYASLTTDTFLTGCFRYYYPYNPAVAETGVERVILTTAQAANLVVGSTVCLGTTTYGSKSTQCSIVDRKKITSITPVTIESVEYSAVYIDNHGTKFDTITGQYLTTMQWYTGSCDDVLGNDGSPYSCTNVKNPSKIQGIEIMSGCYEVLCDTILQYYQNPDVWYVRPAICRDASKLSTSITGDYAVTNYGCPCPASAGENYVKKLGIDADLPEAMFPCETGGSSSTFTRDAAYLLASAASVYEWLAFGSMEGGHPTGGLSRLGASYGLLNTTRVFGGRVSVTGNRGEWSA